MNPSNWLQKLRLRLNALFRKRSLDADMEAEMRSHIELREQANIEAGMNPAEARRAARRQFGSSESIKETCRDQRGVLWLENLAQDLRFGARQLRKNPGFTTVAVLTLALGIGATTAITSVVRTAVFNPVPVSRAERLVVLKARDREKGWLTEGLNPVAARDVEAATNLFRRTVFLERDWLTYEVGNFPENIGGVRVSSGFFSLFAVPPKLGRLPSVEDSAPGAPPVVVLSCASWRNLFGGDPAIVGKTVRFKQTSATVIGVMPPHFMYPGQTGFWRPWSGPDAVAGEVVETSQGFGPKSLSSTGVIAEIAEGVDEKQAPAFLAVVQARQARTDHFQTQFTFISQSFLESLILPEIKWALWAVTVAAILVLLIVAANLANLQLARVQTRQQELAVRSALGAGRARIFRQLLGENLLLALLGGGAGLLVTWYGLDLIASFVPPELPRLRPIELDRGALALACLVTLATGIVFGVAPAWMGGGAGVGANLKQASPAVTGARHPAMFARGLIIGQMAIVLVLLAGAGLMVRSVGKLLAVDVGFDPRHVVKLYPPLNNDIMTRHMNSDQGMAKAKAYVDAVYRDLQQRIAALPGVEAVGVAQVGGALNSVSPKAGGPPVDPGQFQEYRVGLEHADPLQALRARLTQGHWLVRGDGERGRERVLLNETAAGRLWPGQTAAGKRLWIKTDNQEESVEVAGVVADLRENAYNELPSPTVFRAAPMTVVGAARALVIRTSVPYGVLRPAVERELKAAGAASAQPAIQPLEEGLFLSTAPQRTIMRFLLFFAGAGLLLASIGLYGVLAYNVSRRTREIGIRVAVGAQHADITRLILRQGFALVLAGAGIGVVLSLMVNRLLKTFLFGVPSHDPITLLAVVAVLSGVAFLACWLPARRATRVHPMVALRTE